MANNKFVALLEQMTNEQKAEFFGHTSAAYNMLEQTFGADNFSKWLNHFCDDEAIVAMFSINNIASQVYWNSVKAAEGK